MAITTGARAVALALTLVSPIEAVGRQQLTPADHASHGDCTGEEIAPRVVRLKIYNQSRMSEADLDAIVDVANRVWLAYGVSFQPQDGTDAVAIVLSNRPSPQTDDRPVVLGTTLFTEGHATPYINLSLAAAEAVADSTDYGRGPFNDWPQDQRDAILVRMLGVALAHEMGHYLLDSAAHSSVGLLRRGLTSRELARAEPSHLQLTDKQRRLLCPAGR